MSRPTKTADDTTPSSAPSSFRWTPLLGALLALIALVFVGKRLIDHWSTLVAFARSPKALIATIAAAIGYGASNLLLSSAWHRLVLWCGADELDRATARSIFARSQLAKYVPGNIFHLAGRQILGRREGLGHRPLAASALLEAWGLVTTALLITSIGLRFAPELPSLLESRISQRLLTFAVIFGLAVPWLLRAWPRWRRWLTERFDLHPSIDRVDLLARAQLDRPARLAIVVLRYLAFFLISGGLLVFIAYLASPAAAGDHLGLVTALAAIAWVGGYLTPGAPAGLGIREAILITSLTPVLGAGDAVITTAAFRAATVTGDLLFWALVPKPRRIDENT